MLVSQHTAPSDPPDRLPTLTTKGVRTATRAPKRWKSAIRRRLQTAVRVGAFPRANDREVDFLPAVTAVLLRTA